MQTLRDFDRANRDPIVGADHKDELPLVVLLHGVRRDGQRGGDDRGRKIDIDERAGPQLTVPVRRYSLELKGSGSRGCLIVDRQQRADIELFRTGLIIDRRLDWPARHCRLDRGNIVARQSKHDADWLHLRQNNDAGRVAGLDQVADVDLQEAGHAVEGRPQRCVVHLRLVAGDEPLVGLHGGRVLRDEKLLVGNLLQGDRILSAKLLIAFEIGLRLGMKGGVPGQLSLRLGQSSLVKTRVDFGQDVAFLDRLAFDEINLFEHARHLALDRGRIQGLNSSEARKHDWLVVLLHLRAPAQQRAALERFADAARVG